MSTLNAKTVLTGQTQKSKNATVKPQGCEPLIEACDRTIKSLQEQNKDLKRAYDFSAQALEIQKDESARLQRQNDAWYRQNPWLLFGLGIATGVVGYVVIKH